MSPVEYRAPEPHRCDPPTVANGQARLPADSVWRCDCGRRWVVRNTHEHRPHRHWYRLRWWHRAARRGLRGQQP